MTHKRISQLGWADKNPNDFSFLDHEIPLVVYSIFSLNCDGLVMGVALPPTSCVLNWEEEAAAKN